MTAVMLLIYVGNTRSHDFCLRSAENSHTCCLYEDSGVKARRYVVRSVVQAVCGDRRLGWEIVTRVSLFLNFVTIGMLLKRILLNFLRHHI